MMRTAAIRRPCTFGKTAGIHEFSASVFISLVIRPLRNITASEPLTKRRPREERSITPEPPSRTAAYSVIRSSVKKLMIEVFSIFKDIAQGRALDLAQLVFVRPNQRRRRIVDAIR